jgi:hypothetical protein
MRRQALPVDQVERALGPVRQAIGEKRQQPESMQAMSNAGFVLTYVPILRSSSNPNAGHTRQQVRR